MTVNPHLEISSIKSFSDPFNYFLIPNFFNDGESIKILKWLRSCKDWQLVKRDFYEQYEFLLNEMDLSKDLYFLKENSTLIALKEIFYKTFGVKLSEKVEISAHKLLAGQTIRHHNDYFPGGETHRIVIQINESFEFENGGLLLLFTSQDPADINKIVNPFHNSAFGFEISPKSFHAVSKIHKGERYTLVYSFFE